MYAGGGSPWANTKFKSLGQVKFLTLGLMLQNIHSANEKRPGNLKLPGRF